MKSNGLIDSIKFLTSNPPGSKFFKNSINNNKGNYLNDKKSLTTPENYSSRTQSKLFKSLSNNNIKKIIENNKNNEKNSKNKIFNINSKLSFTFKKSNCFSNSNTYRLKRNNSASSKNNSLLKRVKNYQLKKYVLSLNKKNDNNNNSLLYNSNSYVINNNNINNDNINDNNKDIYNYNSSTNRNKDDSNIDLTHLKKMINLVEDLEKENFLKEYNLKIKIIEDLEENIFNLKSFLRSYSVEKNKNDYEKFKLEKLISNLLYVGQKYNNDSDGLQKIFVEIVELKNKIKLLKDETKIFNEKYKEEENNIKEINILIGETNKEISLIRRDIKNTIPGINLLIKHNEELKSKINFKNNYQSNFMLNVNEMIENIVK